MMKKLLSEQDGKDLMKAAQYLVFRASRWAFAATRKRIPVQRWRDEVLFTAITALETWEEGKGASPKSWCYGKMNWAVRARLMRWLRPYQPKVERHPPSVPTEYVREPRFDREAFWDMANLVQPSHYITAALRQTEGLEIDYQDGKRVVEFGGKQVTAAWVHLMYTKAKHRLGDLLKKKGLELDDFYY